MIASEATPDKNKLTTGTLTYDNIENNASYSAGSSGLSYRKFANGAYGAGEGHNMKGLTPVLSVPARGDASSTTKSAVAAGTIDGQHLQGKQILEIPASNQTFEKIDEYKAIAERYGVEIRFREE